MSLHASRRNPASLPSPHPARPCSIAFAAVLLLVAVAAHAATPEQSCQKGRYDAAAKYVGCNLKAHGKAIAAGDLSDPYNAALAKCALKYAATWAKLAARATGTGSTCDAPRFVVDPNGTVTDNLTALQWERKTDDATIHDRDDTYQMAATIISTGNDGSVFRIFLPALNGSFEPCFAGTCDWRLPTVIELQTILLTPTPCQTNPCIDQAVFGPSSGGSHWTGDGYGSATAWVVDFVDGYVLGAPRTNGNFVRAVRGGL